jgi:hypothetical protein
MHLDISPATPAYAYIFLLYWRNWTVMIYNLCMRDFCRLKPAVNSLLQWDLAVLLAFAHMYTNNIFCTYTCFR